MGQAVASEITRVGREGTDVVNSLLPGLSAERKELITPTMSTAIDRSDLVTRLQLNTDRYVRLEANNLSVRVVLGERGEITRIRSTAQALEAIGSRKRIVEFIVPGIKGQDDSSHVHVLGSGQVFSIRINSDECPKLPTIIKRCYERKGRSVVDEIVDLLLTVLGCGGETLNLTICHQMLELEFDKIDILGEKEDVSITERKVPHVITSFLWARVHHYKLLPKRDNLAQFFKEVDIGRKSRQRIVREMRSNHQVPEEEIQRFIEGTGGPQSVGPKTDRFLRMMAAQAATRPFEKVEGRDVTFALSPRAKPGLDPRVDVHLRRQHDDDPSRYSTIRENVLAIISELLEQRGLPSKAAAHGEEAPAGHEPWNDWQLLVGWEPLRVTNFLEAMHEARRCAVAGDHMGFIRFALKAVQLNTKSRHKQRTGTESGKDIEYPSKEAFSDSSVDAILSANKFTLSDMIKKLHDGELPRERFEEHFQNTCDSVMNFIDQFLMPLYQSSKEEKVERVVLCLQTKADYLRYLHVFVPSRRTNMHEAEELYEKAIKQCWELKEPRSLEALTTCVNYAVFCSEVRRRNDVAARVCRKGIAKGTVELERMQEFKWRAQMGPSQIFNWHLLKDNLAAFESQLIFLKISFRPNDMAAHEEVEARPGDPGYADAGVVQPTAANAKRRGLAGLWTGGASRKSQLAEPQPRQLEPALAACLGLGGRGGRTCLQAGRDSLIERQPTPPELVATPKGEEVVTPQAKPIEAAGVTARDRAVLRWLRARPLFVRGRAASVDADGSSSDQEDTSKPSGGHIASVRWVHHTEQSGPDLQEWHGEVQEADASPMGGARDSVDFGMPTMYQKFQAAAVRVMHVNAVAHAKETLEPDYCIVGCVVRLKEDAMSEAVHSGDLHQDWVRHLKMPLLEWPFSVWKPGNHGDRQNQILTLETEDSLMELVDKMDADGIILRRHSQGELQLLPGDTLLLTGALEKYLTRGSTTALFKDIRDHTLKAPLQMEFLPCMRTEHVHPLAVTPYTEVHEKFIGFREGGNLHPTGSLSLAAMINGVRSTQSTRNGHKGGKVAPLRIRGLSARRDPATAGERGCR